MTNPFFSIIIPAYNTIRYLPTCIDSILAQSCDDFEIVLVDDASTDGTGELVDQQASRDGRIHVLHVPHSGVSAARNAGLKAAAGEYILFMDSDDMLVSDALERIREKLCGNPDMLWFGFLYQREDGSVHEGQKLRDATYIDVSDAVVDWIENNMLPVSACNKVFRLPLIREFGIAFREEYSFGEDRLFNLDYLKHCVQVVTSSDNLYVYTVRDGSASHRFVPGILSILLALHEERVSALLPLCIGKMPDSERRDFIQTNYIKSVNSAWLHLAGYYPALTVEQREQELRAYLDICPPERIAPKALTRRAYLWFAALNAAARFDSLPMLKLMMSIIGLISGKGKL